MKKRMFLSVVAMAALMMVLFASPVLAQGRLTVRIDDQPLLSLTPEWADLLALIAYAEALYADTPYTYEAPHLAPLGVWAAPQAARNVFLAAIEAARAALSLGQFSPGEEFNMTIGIASNPGFAGMIMEFSFPHALQVVAFEHLLEDLPNPALENPIEGFVPVRPLIPHAMNGLYRTQYSTATHHVYYMGWAGRDTNVTGSGDFFTVRLRVLDVIDVNDMPFLLDAIRVRVSNALNEAERATNAAGNPVDVMLPCGRLSWQDNAIQLGEVGRVTVVAP